MNTFPTDDELNQEESPEERQKRLALQNTRYYSIEEFQSKILDGELSDSVGTAYLVINGAPSTYNVYIDRRCVTRSDGSLVTFAGILKMYTHDQLSIMFKKKEQRLRRR